MTQRIKPLFNNILIKPLEKKKPDKSGIYVPSNDQDEIEGEVISTGNGAEIPVTIKGLGGFENLVRSEIIVKTGQHVIFKKYVAIPIKTNEEKYYLVDQKDILAIIEYY